MKKKSMRSISTMTGAVMLISGYAQQAVAQETAVNVQGRNEENYDIVANVQGEFLFSQDVLTPTDEVFSLFGTVATAMCATPRFALEEVDEADYYINFGGSVLKTQTVSLAQLKEQKSRNLTLKCSCGMGPAIANAEVVGVPLTNIVEMVGLEENVNTVKVKGGDGYELAIPLTYALEKDALLVYQIGDQAEPTGVQLWMPKSVARYFARNVVDVEFTCEAEEPEVLGPNAELRAKVNVLNRFGENPFGVGDRIEFKGYADDFDQPIAAVEFSMDNGATWTTCSTEGATADKWVYWHFGYVTEAPGTYKLDVRAVAADGTVSPLASSVVFTVE